MDLYEQMKEKFFIICGPNVIESEEHTLFMCEKIKEIINDPKNQSNIDLIECMDFLSNEHEELKNTILKLTYHLDEVEFSYNKILEEYKNRTK